MGKKDVSKCEKSQSVIVTILPQTLLLKAMIPSFGDLMSKTKKTKKKMEKAEKDCVYYCDACGCEMVCTTPSKGPLVCCDQIMYCC